MDRDFEKERFRGDRYETDNLPKPVDDSPKIDKNDNVDRIVEDIAGAIRDRNSDTV